MRDEGKAFCIYTNRVQELGGDGITSGRRGYTIIEVLPFLIGCPLDDVAFSYIHGLRPSRVRICCGFINDDSSLWRVNVWIDVEGVIRRVEQEVEVALPEGVQHGHHLNVKFHMKETINKWSKP